METRLSSSILSREGSEPGLCLLNIVPFPFKRSLCQFCLLLSSLKIFAYLVHTIAMLIILMPGRCSVGCCLFTLLLLPSVAPTARISKTLILVVNLLLCILDLGVCSLDIFPDLTLLGLQWVSKVARNVECPERKLPGGHGGYSSAHLISP